FGVSVRPLMMGKNFSEAAKQLREALSPAHLGFLKSLQLSTFTDRFFLCHAGVRPSVPLGNQNEDDLLWIRGEFLNSDVDFGKIVVHGHTPIAEPEFRPNRINIDTGAFATGRLTCLVIDGETYRTITT